MVAALVGLCTLAGCSNSRGDALGHQITTSASGATTSITIALTTTASPASSVLAAYRAGWSAFEHALVDANPNDRN